MTTYYVDYTGGVDTNNGTSTGTAWKTAYHVSQQSYSPGDSILFKRGEVWRDSLYLEHKYGTAGSPITFADYGTGAKPMFMGSVDVSGAGAWTQYLYPLSSVQIAASTDDADNGPAFAATGNYIRVGKQSTSSCTGGFRFLNCPMPAGSTIHSAYFSFDPVYGYSGASLHTRIYGEAADSPGTWASTTHEPASASLTTAYVDYSPTSLTAATYYDSPDLTTIIQEIVNRGGWASGNSLDIIWKDNGSSNTHWVSPRAWDNQHTGMILHVEYEPPAYTPPSNVWRTTTKTVEACCLWPNNQMLSNTGQRMKALADLVSQGQHFHPYQTAWTTTDYTYMYSVGNPGTFYSHIEMALRFNNAYASQAQIYVAHCSYITICNIDMRYGGAFGIRLYGASGHANDHIIIEDNEIRCLGGAWDSSPPTPLYADTCDGYVLLGDNDNVIVRRNLAYNVYEAALMVENPWGAVTCSNVSFYQNICHLAKSGFEYAVQTTAGTVDALYVCGNVFYGMGHNWAYGQRWYAEGNYEGMMAWNSPGTTMNAYFRNNIIAACKDRFIYTQPLDDWQAMNPDYNCYWQCDHDPTAGFKIVGSTYNFAGYKTALGGGRESHSINVDPLFVDPDNGDFHLRAGSPCRDTGVVIANVGQTPYGAGPDMGAVEYVKKCGMRKP